MVLFELAKLFDSSYFSFVWKCGSVITVLKYTVCAFPTPTVAIHCAGMNEMLTNPHF